MVGNGVHGPRLARRALLLLGIGRRWSAYVIRHRLLHYCLSIIVERMPNICRQSQFHRLASFREGGNLRAFGRSRDARRDERNADDLTTPPTDLKAFGDGLLSPRSATSFCRRDGGTDGSIGWRGTSELFRYRFAIASLCRYRNGSASRPISSPSRRGGRPILSSDCRCAARSRLTACREPRNSAGSRAIDALGLRCRPQATARQQMRPGKCLDLPRNFPSRARLGPWRQTWPIETSLSSAGPPGRSSR